MNNVGITMSTSVFGKLGINGNLNFDPVRHRMRRGGRINKFNIIQNRYPAQTD